jgi:hypothetical protein
VTFHEVGHILLGHTTTRWNMTVRQIEREADFAAGYLLARTGHAASKYTDAWMDFRRRIGPADFYGTRAQRLAATRAGLAAGRGRGKLPPLFRPLDGAEIDPSPRRRPNRTDAGA